MFNEGVRDYQGIMKIFSGSRVFLEFFPDKQEKTVMNKFVLENRLIDFSVRVVESIEMLEKRGVNVHLKEQVIRSCTACSLNYGEAQSAESRKDFIHKLGIVMKELRETQINLKMLTRLNEENGKAVFAELIKENDELLAIMFRTIQTTRKNS